MCESVYSPFCFTLSATLSFIHSIYPTLCFQSILASLCWSQLLGSNSQTHVSTPSSSLVVHLSSWHCHWTIHCHLTLHIPRPSYVSYSLLVFLKVAPSFIPMYETNRVLGSKHQYCWCLPDVQTLAPLFPAFKVFLLWLFSGHSHSDCWSSNPPHFMSDYPNSLLNMETIFCEILASIFFIFPLSFVI